MIHHQSPRVRAAWRSLFTAHPQTFDTAFADKRRLLPRYLCVHLRKSVSKTGMFHSPVDSFIDAFGGDRMAIIRLNHHDSSPSTTDQRRYDEVYQTSRLRSSNPYRHCQRRLAPSRHLRQDDPDCSSVSHLQNLSLSALLGCQTSLGRPLERSPTPCRAPCFSSRTVDVNVTFGR